VVSSSLTQLDLLDQDTATMHDTEKAPFEDKAPIDDISNGETSDATRFETGFSVKEQKRIVRRVDLRLVTLVGKS
jgi:hypothetical protein